MIEMAHVFNVLSAEDINQARNMLFSMAVEFDLTTLGEELLLDGREYKQRSTRIKAF